ncbi:50S ribosomal protein L23 [Longimicrobium sp.]|uniref:50S ribosomal protein L23 n=1 Tax=Longimicrobium sp. TaxID=2029185 RepID=UPI002E300CC1|nr:50S ribosomal protein L23 [Longimicrobium sp.]HEX6039942.1 50S ribosomal protein L23 [Longimicrobium sp.]
MRNISQILVRPLVTEKSHEQLDRHGAYTFVVANDANKIEIAHAIEKQFNVKVKDVRTMRYAGKEKRMGRWVGRKASWKKAVVTLAEGDSIEIFEGV